MQLGEIAETKPLGLPRVHQEFIGISHQLQNRKKQRKQIQQQQRVVENRVIHLQKQKNKALKKIQTNKKRLQDILNTKQRQQYQTEEKIRLKMLREQELQRLKKQNQMMRILHQSNLNNQTQQIRNRNHSDYSRIRQQLIDGEYRKKIQKSIEANEKKDHWVSLNISKQKGKIKVDKFYKKKNKQYLEFYKSRIQNEDKTKSNKINNIKQLQHQQQKLRKQLENTTIRASQMVELVNRASRTLSPMDTRTIEAQLNMQSTSAYGSKKTMGYTERQSTSMREQSEGRQRQRGNDEVEEDIQVSQDMNQKMGFRMVTRRKKNKHSNRYKQYEAF